MDPDETAQDGMFWKNHDKLLCSKTLNVQVVIKVTTSTCK